MDTKTKGHTLAEKGRIIELNSSSNQLLKDIEEKPPCQICGIGADFSISIRDYTRFNKPSVNPPDIRTLVVANFCEDHIKQVRREVGHLIGGWKRL